MSISDVPVYSYPMFAVAKNTQSGWTRMLRWSDDFAPAALSVAVPSSTLNRMLLPLRGQRFISSRRMTPGRWMARAKSAQSKRVPPVAGSRSIFPTSCSVGSVTVPIGMTVSGVPGRSHSSWTTWVLPAPVGPVSIVGLRRCRLRSSSVHVSSSTWNPSASFGQALRRSARSFPIYEWRMSPSCSGMGIAPEARAAASASKDSRWLRISGRRISSRYQPSPSAFARSFAAASVMRFVVPWRSFMRVFSSSAASARSFALWTASRATAVQGSFPVCSSISRSRYQMSGPPFTADIAWTFLSSLSIWLVKRLREVMVSMFSPQ